MKFIADVLYIKGCICFDEFCAIMEATTPVDLEDIIEKMLKEDFNHLTGQKRDKSEVINSDW